MGGQMLGGGVIVLVAVGLWLMYLVPLWQGRHRYTSAERNAIRLNQALRVLAESSETPREVELELTARTVYAQSRLAKQVQEHREQAELEHARAELERERAAAVRARELARTQAAVAREQARAEAAATRALPEVRTARVRRRARLVMTLVVAVGLVGAAGGGALMYFLHESAVVFASGAAVAVIGVLLRWRMGRVAQRAASRVREIPEVVRASAPMQDVELAPEERAGWTPRTLPRPLTASEGSRAAAVLDAQEARQALAQAPVEEALRARAEQGAPPSLERARRGHVAAPAELAGAADEQIEAHVRQLLERRVSGQ